MEFILIVLPHIFALIAGIAAVITVCKMGKRANEEAARQQMAARQQEQGAHAAPPAESPFQKRDRSYVPAQPESQQAPFQAQPNQTQPPAEPRRPGERPQRGYEI